MLRQAEHPEQHELVQQRAHGTSCHGPARVPPEKRPQPQEVRQHELQELRLQRHLAASEKLHREYAHGEPSIAGFGAGFIVADGPSIVLDAQGYGPMLVEFEQHEIYSRGIVGRLDVPSLHVLRHIFVRSRRLGDRLGL